MRIQVKVFMMLRRRMLRSHRLDIDIKNIQFDVMLASYIIDPSRTIDDVRSVVTHYHQNYVKDDISIYGKGKKRSIPDDEVLNTHIASITEAIHESQPLMFKELEAHNQIDLLQNLELPLARILGKWKKLVFIQM